MGTIYALHLGEPFVDAERAPSTIYFVRETDEGLRVIGSRVRCRDCRGQSVSCSYCTGSGSVYADGEDLRRPGKLLSKTLNGVPVWA